MPVRLKITLLFTLIVFIILAIVCGSVYYVSYIERANFIKTRLKNRAITTARLLSQAEMFPQEVLERIDASTAINVKDKTVQAYDELNRKIYSYSDAAGDSLTISADILKRARANQHVFFTVNRKEAVAYHYKDNKVKMVVVSAAYDEEGKTKLKQLEFILWLSFSAGVLIAFVSGTFFSQRLLMPIRKISDEVNEISAQNLAKRLLTRSARDEWYYLSDTLNKLLNRLQDSFETQRLFISNASHELSTPLTSISSQLQVSLQRNREASEYREVMHSISEDVRQMSNLTQTLLEFAKASGSAGGLEIEQVRIDEILLSLLAQINKLNSQYNVTLNFDDLPTDETRLLVLGNEALLSTALRNIITNACKYSGDHLALVSLAVERNKVVIAVRDKGIGIPKEELEQIFYPFYRTDTGKTEAGFGLGLSLANRIIKLHKGQIDLESVPGQGTLVTVILPSAS